MKDAREIFERFAGDEAFRNVVLDKLAAKREAGADGPAEAFAVVATDLGYEVSAEQAEAFFSRPGEGGGLSKVTDGDLDQVAGGYLFLMEKSGLGKDQVIDDKTGKVLAEDRFADYRYALEAARKYGVSAKSITWEELYNLRNYGSINP